MINLALRAFMVICMSVVIKVYFKVKQVQNNSKYYGE